MQDALRARQANIDHINTNTREMKEEVESMGSSLPENLQRRVDKLNADWAKIRQMAGHLRPTSDADLAQKMMMQQSGKVKGAEVIIKLVLVKISQMPNRCW